MAWRLVKVTLTPKHGKSHYTEDKAYRPISVSSFLLKTMEKLVDRHITNTVLKEHALYQNKHAYQIGKSTETALHNVVTHTESAIKYQEIALRAFLDTEGAFDRTSFDVLTQAAERHGTEPTICRWISSMLESRTIITALSRETMRVSMARGCPQGGVFLPLL
jgi:hypothetical protein